MRLCFMVLGPMTRKLRPTTDDEKWACVSVNMRVYIRVCVSVRERESVCTCASACVNDKNNNNVYLQCAISRPR